MGYLRIQRSGGFLIGSRAVNNKKIYEYDLQDIKHGFSRRICPENINPDTWSIMIDPGRRPKEGSWTEICHWAEQESMIYRRNRWRTTK